MIIITHKKRYESIKKERKEKNIKLDFVDYQDNHAIVIETTYNNAMVLYKDKIIKVTLSNMFKSSINKTIYPGDKVILEKDKIISIIKRKNILSREKYDGTKLSSYGSTKITAANIDIAVIVIAINNPPIHPKFIDRYIILLENSNIPFVICFNKYDLISKEEEKIIKVYEELGYQIIKTSTLDNKGIEDLKNIIKDKQSIFVGTSGVGKSSLTNSIMNYDKIKVGKVRDKNKRGCHTTTDSKYYQWDNKSSIIDTPGIRSLDLKHFNVEDIKSYFKEFIPYNGTCKYKDCLHFEEPIDNCKIKQLVGTKITKERYESYYKIINEIKRK